MLLGAAVLGFAGWWLYADRPQQAAATARAERVPADGRERDRLLGSALGHGLDSRRRVLDGRRRIAGMNMVGMQATTDSRPIHRVYVDGFWMDATEVTNDAVRGVRRRRPAT